MVNFPKKILYSYAIPITVVVRIITSLLLIVNPFWGIILYLIGDSLDGPFLNLTLKLSIIEYHRIDKVLDEFGLVCMVISGLKFGFFWPLVILFALRLIGSILFYKTEKRIYFILFPNFLEPVYVVMVSLRSIGMVLPSLSWNSNLFWLVIFIGQVFIELWIHFLVPKYIYWLLKNTLVGKIFLAKENARTT